MMSENGNLWIMETYVDRDQDARFGEAPPHEADTDNVRELFVELLREYGRCRSKQYVDRKDGTVAQVGWVFEKRKRYTNSLETYLQETWVTVWNVAPEHVPEHWTGGVYAF